MPVSLPAFPLSLSRFTSPTPPHGLPALPRSIRFFTQELCFIRANVVETLLRCALHKPEAAKGTFTRIMREHSDGRGAEAAAQASSSIRKGTGMGAMEEEEEEEEESTAGAAGGDGGATALDSVESALDVGGASITQHVRRRARLPRWREAQGSRLACRRSSRPFWTRATCARSRTTSSPCSGSLTTPSASIPCPT